MAVTSPAAGSADIAVQLTQLSGWRQLVGAVPSVPHLLPARAAGMPIRAIARAHGHSPGTVRDYVHGRRAPGEPAARADDFAPFAGYCRQGLADDPHLKTPALLAELGRLGLDGSRALSTGAWCATASSLTPAPAATRQGSADTPR